MGLKDFKKITSLNYDLINIFTDYSIGLEQYFKSEDNRINHSELFEEFQVLNKNIKELKRKYNLWMG